MKEQLKNLRDVTIEIVKTNDDFKKQRNFFNMKVEEKNSELNIEEIFKSEEEETDAYLAASILNCLFPQIHEIVTSIRNEHPKYGNKRVKDMAVAELTTLMQESQYLVSFANQIDVVVDNYLLYESCGYFKLLEKEAKISELEEAAKVSTDAVLNESKEAAIKAKDSIVDFVKPYGEVAKTQFDEAKVTAKDMINKGSKQLIKFLEKLEDKTKTK